MPFTSADLTQVDAAIARGTQRVRFADGREVTYQSVADMLRARDLIAGELSVGGSPERSRSTRVVFVRD